MFQSTDRPDQTGRRHHHRDPRQGPPGFPFGFRDRMGRDRSGRNAMRRGEIRPLVLATLTLRPMHGYEVIQELEAQSGGRWRPSAGSVYPTLQQLADEGLVTSTEIDGRRTYTLTAEGRAAAAAVPARPAWGDSGRDGEFDLRQFHRQLLEAMMLVQRVGSPRARSEATRILTDARRDLYRLLADDEASAGDAGPTTTPGDAPADPPADQPADRA